MQFKYVYFNHTNLAQKTSIHGGSAHRSANIPPDILRLISDVNLDLNVYVSRLFFLHVLLVHATAAAVSVDSKVIALH